MCIEAQETHIDIREQLLADCLAEAALGERIEVPFYSLTLHQLFRAVRACFSSTQVLIPDSQGAMLEGLHAA